jgi:dicarboxylate transporter 10
MSSAEAPAVAPASSAEAKQTKRNQQKKAPSIRYPFWFGGSASSMAACVTHPLDLGMSQSSLLASLP